VRREHRPHVIMQMAASVDGRIALGPDMTMFDTHQADALIPDDSALWEKISLAIEEEWHPEGTIMGSGTVISSGAPLRELPVHAGNAGGLYEDFLPGDVLGRTTTWAILVDGRGRCRSGYKATETPGNHILHLVSASAPAAYLAFLRSKNIPYLIGGEGHADLESALFKLHEKLRLNALRLWGGGTLNGVMLRKGLVDEVHLILRPVIIGGRRTPTLADCDDLAPDGAPAQLELLSATNEAEGCLWLHYRVRAGHPPSRTDRT